jgi:Holliday junction resolvase RusA-like endonuclease
MTNQTIASATIQGRPVAKQRPRFGAGRVWTPAKTKAWEKAAALLLRASATKLQLQAPVVVVVVAVWSRPKRKPQAVSSSAWSKPGRIWRTSTPDVDNVAKAALDAINRSRVIEDDRYVVHLSAFTVYGAIGEESHVSIQVQTAPDL